MAVFKTHSAPKLIRAKQLMAEPISIEKMMQIMSHCPIITSLYFTVSDSTQNDPTASSNQPNKT